MKQKFILIIFLLTGGLKLYAQTWQSSGPNEFPKGFQFNNYAARSAGNRAFFNLAVQPDDPLHVFTTGVVNTGIRRHFNNGSWQSVNAGFPAIPSNCKIKFDPTLRNGVYTIYGSSHWGIFKSDDYGLNWTNTGFTTSGLSFPLFHEKIDLEPVVGIEDYEI